MRGEITMSSEELAGRATFIGELAGSLQQSFSAKQGGGMTYLAEQGIAVTTFSVGQVCKAMSSVVSGGRVKSSV